MQRALMRSTKPLPEVRGISPRAHAVAAPSAASPAAAAAPATPVHSEATRIPKKFVHTFLAKGQERDKVQNEGKLFSQEGVCVDLEQ